MTQNQMVLAYMKEHGSISSMEAFSELRITRLSGRIFELRAAGHEIVNVPRKAGAMRWVEYKLKEPLDGVEPDERLGDEAVRPGFVSEITTKNRGGQINA